MRTEFLKKAKLLLLSFLFLLSLPASGQIIVGADQPELYLDKLKGKRIALVVNQTSRVGEAHLLDFLLSKNVNVVRAFAPEHGFRGEASAGAHIQDGKDAKTGLPIVSLYGKTKKPAQEHLQDVDLVLFDIQDVGARFYTYISTLHYVMEACAENRKPLLLLDRPNPNGNYIDGPVLKKEFQSFVGMHPVPVVHGMTIGEYARMINGEGWLPGKSKCKLTVISVKGYTHDATYDLPVPPSPNLPTMESIYLYPSLCLFEGTPVSVGRGTEKPFECVGLPGFKEGNYSFVPRSIPGKAEEPPHKGDTCRGFLLTRFANDFIRPSRQLYLYWLQGFYEAGSDKEKFFTPFFDKLAGTDALRKSIQAGKTPNDICDGWREELKAFQKVRKKYLLYPDFSKLDWMQVGGN